MKTLIELYDQRPQENVLGAEVFRPERTVYICPREVAENKKSRRVVSDYLKRRGIPCELVFLPAFMFSAESVLAQLRRAVDSYEDCAVDITGGSDAALFAAGLLCADRNVPVFTYSRRRNCFFSIHGAEFAEELPCTVEYSVEDCFLMAGGSMRKGRVDNRVLSRYDDVIDPFFRVYLEHKSDWNRTVSYFQHISQPKKDGEISLSVSGGYTVKGERGQALTACEPLLRDLEKIGLLEGLRIDPKRSVSFRFRDTQVRTWLRDIGSVLELYVYKACRDTGLFQDVVTSAVVDWEGDNRQGNVTNEIDVMACAGITPVFISCKTCSVNTEALNELAILRDRFGGSMARAAIVTSTNGTAIMRKRAAELGIAVIELKDLRAGVIRDRIKALMK